MKKILLMVVFVVLVQGANAQTGILEIIKAAVVKVIKAVDLKIQRLQNKTIWLQNAQKVVENKMSELKLNEISGWVEKQRKLYDDYYEELWKIKGAISTYNKVKSILDKQVKITTEYSKAFSIAKQDKNFTASEVSYIDKVYQGILNESFKNLEELQLVISAFRTQMSDAKRLEIIQKVSVQMEQNLSDLRQFNQQNIKMSLQRAKEAKDIDVVRKLYGL